MSDLETKNWVEDAKERIARRARIIAEKEVEDIIAKIERGEPVRRKVDTDADSLKAISGDSCEAMRARVRERLANEAVEKALQEIDEQINKLTGADRMINYRSLSEEERTWEVSLLAVLQDPCNLKYVPKSVLDEVIVYECVKRYGPSIQYVPQNMRTDKVVRAAVSNDGMSLVYLQEFAKNFEIAELAVRNNGNALSLIPVDYRHPKLNKLAVENNGEALRFVLDYQKDYPTCLAAVKNDGKAILYMPDKYINQDMRYEACKSNPLALGCMPYESRDPFMVKIALERSPSLARQFVPDEYFDNEGKLLPLDEMMDAWAEMTQGNGIAPRV